MLFDELAKLVAIFIRHDDVADDGVRNCLGEQADCRSDVGASDDIKIFAAKRDLYDLAHRGAVVNEINVRRGTWLRNVRVTHVNSFSGNSCCASSYSRIASSNKSIA